METNNATLVSNDSIFELFTAVEISYVFCPSRYISLDPILGSKQFIKRHSSVAEEGATGMRVWVLSVDLDD